jgi:hypothetical protein
MGMFKRQDCPEAFLRWAADHKSDEVKLALISNKRAPKEILERFARSRNKRIAEAAKAHEKLAGEISEDELDKIFFDAVRGLLEGDVRDEISKKYIGLAQFPYLSESARVAWAGAAANPNCLKKGFIKLFKSTNATVLQGVVKGDRVVINFEELASHRYYLVRKAVASSLRCPADVLAILARDRQKDVRTAVAANPRCPTDVLAILARDKQKDVRTIIARHSAAPVSALTKLTEDRDSSVRSAVASNLKCPSELLEKLATDKTAEVRRRVAEHKNCPLVVLERLLKDSNWPVMRTAISNGQCTESLRNKASRQIAEEGSFIVRKAAAKEWGNEFLQSRDLVKALAADEKPVVRKALAGNPKCPSHHYEALLNDDNDSVRLAAALNASHRVNARLICEKPASSPWLQAQLAKAEAKFPGTTAAVQDGNMLFPAPKTGKALRSTSLLGRIIALSQPNAPPAELARASGYRDWRQRMAIARNPAAPPKILDKLSKDSNRYVAAQANATLRRDEKQSRVLAARLEAGTASKSIDVDYRLLSRWIGEWVRTAAGKSLQIGPAILLSRPVEAWADYVPISAWWNPNSLSAGKIQKAWNQIYGSKAPVLIELLQIPPIINDEQLVERLAGSRYCPKELLQSLGTCGIVAVRQATAGNANYPTALLLQLSADRSRNVRLAVAANKRCPRSALDSLSANTDLEVRRSVAEHPKCPADLLEKLATDKEARVRRAIADNPQCPANLLNKLAMDQDQWVRRNVVEHPNCPEILLPRLATDKDAYVRENVAEHSNCPVAALEKLATDKNARVRASVADNPNCPAKLLAKLANDKIEWVRRIVAANPKCPGNLLAQLATDKDAYVRENVAENPKCPAAILAKLAIDKDEDVRKGAEANLARRRKNA